MLSRRPAGALALCIALAACGDGGGGPGSPRDAASGPDGPVVDAAVGIECKSSFCELPEICCRDQLNPPRITYFCIPGENPDVCMGARYRCDGPEDCAEGEECCTGGADSDVHCVEEGTCDSYVVCHVTEQCPPGFVCADTPAGLIRACQ